MSATNLTSDFIQDIPVFSTVVCPSWFRQELFDNAKNISIIIILGFINAIVIVGNLLVVMAVFASAKLRTVTNFLIVSLAISDLLVGLAVLPYSISLEVLELWIFGELWCQMWLAVDVWLCTASILNLCAISIDRYLAITRPVHYRTIMSTLKVKLLIASVWILSFIICFPPLVGWNDRVQDGEDITSTDNITAFSEMNRSHLSSQYFMENRTVDAYALKIITSNFTDEAFNGSIINDEVKFITRNISSRRCPKPQCALITNQGYVIYSALGSFYIPMLVMLFFYYRIYVVALKTSRALDRGFRTAKSSKSKSSSGGQEGGGGSDVTLRIHRGRPTSESMSSSRSCASASTSAASSRRSGDILVPRRIPTVVYHHTKELNSPRCFREDSTKNYYTTRAADESSPFNSRVRRTRSATPASTNRSLEIEVASTSTTEHPRPDHLAVSGSGEEQQRNGKSGLFSSSKSSKRNARWHAKRFRTEAKATKTVGIIVGGFILCWLPFFTVYLIMGFCEPCIPELLFKVFFYLGYCNSALNPIIYGIISKDFRAAFKKILCRCTLNDDSVASLIRHIHMPTFTEEEVMQTGESSSQT
ncbi:octopamine receptor Oamb [Nephila pilipes]|uniref:Octopamine receptor Oamb n=1 Tax=Nephila pilipes TaxID=299642 RepID=A0A8X6N405_NEPPI|nr:octopamine receptor Oamb [Nephila pilipes]